MSFTEPKLSQTFASTDIVPEGVKRRPNTRIGLVFDGELVFEVRFSVRDLVGCEKHVLLSLSPSLQVLIQINCCFRQGIQRLQVVEQLLSSVSVSTKRKRKG